MAGPTLSASIWWHQDHLLPFALGAGASSRFWEASTSKATGMKRTVLRTTSPSGRGAACCCPRCGWVTPGWHQTPKISCTWWLPSANSKSWRVFCAPPHCLHLPGVVVGRILAAVSQSNAGLMGFWFQKAEIVQEWSGLRPARPTVRLEQESIGHGRSRTEVLCSLTVMLIGCWWLQTWLLLCSHAASAQLSSLCLPSHNGKSSIQFQPRSEISVKNIVMDFMGRAFLPKENLQLELCPSWTEKNSEAPSSAYVSFKRKELGMAPAAVCHCPWSLSTALSCRSTSLLSSSAWSSSTVLQRELWFRYVLLCSSEEKIRALKGMVTAKCN